MFTLILLCVCGDWSTTMLREPVAKTVNSVAQKPEAQKLERKPTIDWESSGLTDPDKTKTVDRPAEPVRHKIETSTDGPKVKTRDEHSCPCGPGCACRPCRCNDPKDTIDGQTIRFENGLYRLLQKDGRVDWVQADKDSLIKHVRDVNSGAYQPQYQPQYQSQPQYQTYPSYGTQSSSCVGGSCGSSGFRLFGRR